MDISADVAGVLEGQRMILAENAAARDAQAAFRDFRTEAISRYFELLNRLDETRAKEPSTTAVLTISKVDREMCAARALDELEAFDKIFDDRYPEVDDNTETHP